MKPLITLMLALLVSFSAMRALSEDDDYTFSDGELDALLAPIALYPDTVLSHLLIAATYPLEVVDAERWARNQKNSDRAEILNQAATKNWDPSVQALTPIPEILARMSEDLSWTERLGDAFLQDESQVLESIQRLRQRAYDEGNLTTNDYQSVSRDQGDIIIEPVQREVVYVPYYDTRVVYGPWWWPVYPPHFWLNPHRHHAHQVGLFFWAPGFFLGHSFYFGGFHWHHRQVVVVRHSHRSYYEGHRRLVVHRDSHRWHHNPQHRRGVSYHSRSVAKRYAGNHSIPSHRIAHYQREQTNRVHDQRVAQQRHETVVNNMRRSQATYQNRQERSSPARANSHERTSSPERTNSPERANSHERTNSHEQKNRNDRDSSRERVNRELANRPDADELRERISSPERNSPERNKKDHNSVSRYQDNRPSTSLARNQQQSQVKDRTRNDSGVSRNNQPSQLSNQQEHRGGRVTQTTSHSSYRRDATTRNSGHNSQRAESVHRSSNARQQHSSR
ncbi:conserved hypothetical protein [Teredinibacter turnerae T7901]|uniref:DUF3300 domain-containing protein n=1 Tax=Teredinibacter turnerae (strain ATCC 39867 / T7901) TaxID=377629 RepID=C5BUK8_TERTT|nr:DUF3300 domain-containing protein [Teredinibacter turnerae]ACR14151.1 conserved hypothetical protein [Teredinibacter turnerae T7901]